MQRLDPTNPQTIDVAEETLNFRYSEFSSEESLLMSAFSLLTTPPNLTVELRRNKNAPLPLTQINVQTSVFGETFSSESFSAPHLHPGKPGIFR